MLWSAVYEAFGETVVNPSSVIENHLRFAGQCFDGESEWHYNWNRYYDPALGRYLSVDPIGFDSKDYNLYRYSFGNPLRYFDETGLAGGAISIPTAICIRYAIKTFIVWYGAKAVVETVKVCNPPKDDACEEVKKCKPCNPPVGTIATEVHRVPPSKPHYPIKGSHVHWFEMNQSPYPMCKCFWKRNIKKPTPGNVPPPGTIPVTPASGGGLM